MVPAVILQEMKVKCTKILACGHTFCVRCLSFISEKDFDDLLQIKCPICREESHSISSIQSLPSRFYGRIKCDKCLQCKKSNDTWWCPSCVQAMCSKCRLTEHSDSHHSVAEWNNLAPAECSLAYVNELRDRKVKSMNSVFNLTALERYFAEVKKALIIRLKTDTVSDYLSEELVRRYGKLSRNLKIDLNEANERNYRTNLLKAAQLADISVAETDVPSLDDVSGYLYFKITPDEAAAILLPSVKLTTVKQPSRRCHDSSLSTAKKGIEINDTRFCETLSVVTCTAATIKVDYFPARYLAILSNSQLVLYSPTRNEQKQLAAPPSYVFVNLCYNRKTEELFLVLRSLNRQHDWILQVIDLFITTYEANFTATFDVGPEDAVECMHIVTSSSGILYVVRDCRNSVSEIWKVVIIRKRLKVKLKETLLYQKDDSCYTNFDVLEADKRVYVIVWDNMNRCLSRLVIRDNHCISVWKILVSPDPIPFCLDAAKRLWLFDPVLSFIYSSSGPVMNNSAISLKKMMKYDSFQPSYIWNSEDKLMAAHCHKNIIRLFQFDKYSMD
ncbi:unnamed protein product, partial [Soboliphyme baturini]|uniref:RING-type domain-containing protein n=1 Tax=Soboliphyme baturini TaxID=241478 RepID=A0A183IRF1_9BILA